MTRKLTRLLVDATAEQRAAFAADFRAALDALGVGPGEEFYLSALPSEAYARRSDPVTSQEAALSVHELREKQRAVLSVVELYCPLTDEDLVRRYQSLAKAGRFPEQSESGIRSRRSELVKAGLVVDTGETKRLDSNRNAVLWSVPPKVAPVAAVTSMFGVEMSPTAQPRNALFDVD